MELCLNRRKLYRISQYFTGTNVYICKKNSISKSKTLRCKNNNFEIVATRVLFISYGIVKKLHLNLCKYLFKNNITKYTWIYTSLINIIDDEMIIKNAIDHNNVKYLQYFHDYGLLSNSKLFRTKLLKIGILSQNIDIVKFLWIVDYENKYNYRQYEINFSKLEVLILYNDKSIILMNYLRKQGVHFHYGEALF